MSELAQNLSTNNFNIPQSKLKAESNEPTLYQTLISGGIGGGLMVLAGHPLDLIKVRQQTIATGNISSYQSLKGIIKAEGIRGLYRGMATPFLASAPIFAVEYSSFELCQKLVKFFSKEKSTGELSLPQVALAGGLAAFPATLVVAPVERVKCILQVQTDGNKSNLIGTLRRLGGLSGIYKGTLATLLRDSVGGIFYFATYVGFKRLLGKESPGPIEILFAGGFAGMANWAVSIPFDVIKSQQQASFTPLTFKQSFKQILVQHGPKGLFKGLSPALLRAFPANAACFLGVEASLHWLRN